MKKLLSILLAVFMVFALVGCGNSTTEEEQQEPEDTTKEIVMITDIGDIDDQSFNQGTYDGVKGWAEKNGKSFAYIKPVDSTNKGLQDAIDLAVESYGAKVIVCPGYVFATPVWAKQSEYPDVHFVILDSSLNDENYTDFTVKENVACFTYVAEISGFLAGYAAVKEGMTNLAYLGGIGYNTVYCYGVGFAQGAEYAANEDGLADGSINLTWDYTGNFDDTPDNKTKAAGLLSSGVECIFTVGGKNQKSCFQAASEAEGNKWIISPDTDSTGLSDKCLTSALKGLAHSVELGLDDLYNNNAAKYFGKVNVLSIADEAVGLCPVFDRFTKFTKEAYDAVYAKILSGEIKVLMPEKSDYVEYEDGTQYLGEGVTYNKVNFNFVAKTAKAQ